ncbi:MAG: CDP-alcohol phosphatidyltransferase family protein [Acidimicrobiia bacterium]|nr:CDP-alcohol phosphatidyltransferase family protein [Acidimicrobiia bacterium]
MLDGRWRTKVEQGLTPIGHGLRRAGVTADMLTVVGLVCSVATGALAAFGELRWAVVGLIASGLPDLLDGTVARTSGSASPRGAFFDSVVDRVSDAVVLGGIAWYLAGTSPYLPVLAFAVAAASMLVSYQRARAEALGFTARGGLMERAERMVVLGAGLFFDVLVPVLWVMLALIGFTAVQRFVKVWRQASAEQTSDRGRAPGTAVEHRRPQWARRRESRASSRRSAGEVPAAESDTEGRGLVAWWESRTVRARERVDRRAPRIRRRSRP